MSTPPIERAAEPVNLWRRDEPESPCVQICVIHPETGLCAGCARTAAEITAWPSMTPEARAEVMATLPARAAAAAPSRGRTRGRAAARRGAAAAGTGDGDGDG